MSVYNDESYVGKAIESIINQTYNDFEFIICIDASTDKSSNVVEKYSKIDNRILIIKNESNIGLAASLNKAINIAQGEYIARMDSDDISGAERFKKQVEYLDSHPNVSWVGSSAILFDESGTWGKVKCKNEPTVLDIYKGVCFVHPSVMIRLCDLKIVGGYTVSELTRRGQDYDLWCKMAYYGFKGYNLNDALIEYRETKDAYKKRKFKYRVDMCKRSLFWHKKMNLAWKYKIYAYRSILVGIIPHRIIMKHHRKKFG